MRLASTKTAAVLCGGLLLALSVPASAAVDAKLLDMLKANGQITAAQYTELQMELARDQKEQQIARQAQQETNEQIAATAKKTNELSSFDQKLAWAAKTQFKGDVRFRQETIKIDGEPNNGGRDKDRQRIRARLGAYTEINPLGFQGLAAEHAHGRRHGLGTFGTPPGSDRDSFQLATGAFALAGRRGCFSGLGRRPTAATGH